MAPIRFDSPPPRPRRLGGRNCCVSKKTLEGILGKRNEELDWSDYRDLFNLCDGMDVYEDRIYFLPWAFEYLRDNPRDGFEYLSQIIWFVSEKEPRLTGDGLTPWCRKAIKTCFEEWTSFFTVVHYDTAACLAKQWVIDHDDIVENSQVAADLLRDLLRFRTHGDLAVELSSSLVASGQADTQAAWFLELARSTWMFFETGGNVDLKPLVLEAKTAIRDLFTDRELLQREYDRLRETLVRAEPSPTYWKDLRAALELKD